MIENSGVAFVEPTDSTLDLDPMICLAARVWRLESILLASYQDSVRPGSNMAVLKRGFALYEALERVPLETLKEELKSLGAVGILTRSQLVKQYLLLAEKNEKSPEIAEQSGVQASSHLKHFTKTYLESIIKRRIPETPLPPSMTKSQLFDIINTSLLHEKDSLPPVRDLRSLFQNLNQRQQIDLAEVLRVLPHIIDLNWLPQNDWNLLREADSDALVQMWKTLFAALPTLSKTEVIWMIQAIDVNVQCIGKNFAIGTMTLEVNFVVEVLTKAQELMSQLSYEEINLLLNFAEKHHPEGRNAPQAKELVLHMLRNLRKTAIDSLSYADLNIAFFSLPTGCFKTDPEVVGAMMKRLFPDMKSYDGDYAWRGINTAIRLSAPLPRVLLDEKTGLSITNLRTLNSQQLLQLLEALIDCNMTSELNVKNLLGAGHYSYNHTPNSASVLIQMHYLLWKRGLHALTHKRLLSLQQIATRSDFRLSTEELLKLGVVFYPHISGDAFARRLLDDLNAIPIDSPDVKTHESLFAKLLESVVDNSMEKPIYSYQFFSLENICTDMKSRLADKLVSFLLRTPTRTREVLAFYAKSALAISFPDALLKFYPNLPKEEICDAAMCLWRHRKSIANVEGAAEQMSHIRLPDLQSVYYLSNLLRNSQSLMRQIPKLLNSSELQFFLPVCYNFNLDVMGSPELKRFFQEQFLPRFSPVAMYGEVLLKNITMLSDLGHPELVGKLTDGLTFFPKMDLPYNTKLIERLITAFITSQSPTLNLLSIARFFEKLSDSTALNQANFRDLSRLFQPIISEISPAFRKTMEDYEAAYLNSMKSSEMPAVLSRLGSAISKPMYTSACQLVTASSKSIGVLLALSKAHLLMPELLTKFLDYLKQASDAQEVLIISKGVLTYCSVLGCELQTFADVRKALSDQKLWSQLDDEAVVNYLYLHFALQEPLGKIPGELMERFFQILPAGDEESLAQSPVTGLMCYKAFLHRSILEARFLYSNDYAGKTMSLDFQRNMSLKPGQAELYTKVHAIRNYLKLPSFPIIESAVQLFRRLRNESHEWKAFESDLDNLTLTGQLWRLNSALVDEKSGWILDAALSKGRVGLMLHTDQDVVKNTKGTEVRLVLSQKIMKEQLERISGWTIIGIRYKIWKAMEKVNKIALLERLAEKYRE